MGRPILLLSLMLVLAGATGAWAQSSGKLAPPGNSAIDEYTEAVPTGSGNTPASGITSTEPAAPIGGQTGQALRAQGADGRAVAALVAATAPPRARKAAQKVARGAAAPAASPAPPAAVKDHGRAPLSSIVSTLTKGSGGDSGGLGVVFPLLLIAALVGVLLARFARRSPQG